MDDPVYQKEQFECANGSGRRGKHIESNQLAEAGSESEGSNVSVDSLLNEVDDEMDDLSLSESENKETRNDGGKDNEADEKD